MQIDIISIFPEIFRDPLGASILGRAQQSGIVTIDCHDLRNWTDDRHRTVDGPPYGGGPGMVMRPEPWFRAVESLRASGQPGHAILLTPQGRRLTQELVSELTGFDRLILLCGRYEGVDERVREHLVDMEVSIGDYVVSGGEIPAMVVVEAIVRLLPGVLGSEASLLDESHQQGLLEYPHYTRPANFRGWQVPDVLLSGNHSDVKRWRSSKREIRTADRRPDLIQAYEDETLNS
jgi:tRNA (guanine37-N1)-methyltransferase